LLKKFRNDWINFKKMSMWTARRKKFLMSLNQNLWKF
jgi:hypothetical protein